MVRFIFFMCCIFMMQSQEKSKVYRLQYEGSINPVTLEIFQNAIDEATEADAECLVIEMDTPGGLMVSMNKIIKKILSSEVPVVIYISPSGSHCGSAGVFITMAAHVAAMAPGTNIGAAHPVTIGGKNDSTSNVMMEKVTNDAVSYIRSISEKNGRNADWAEQAVRESVSITETEALNKNVIDLIATNFDSLLIQLDSLKVETVLGKKTIHTKNAEIITIETAWKFEFLGLLTNPNVAYILMMLGVYGLFFELYNPGSLVPGIVGSICLILAFFAFQSLPINYAGVFLILLGVIFFLLEIKVTSYGILSIGGTISLLLGSMMLIDSPDEMFQISKTVIVSIVLISAAFFSVILHYGIKAQKHVVQSGVEQMVGEEGVAMENFEAGEDGKIMVHGEIWNAKAKTTIQKNDEVRIIALHKMNAIIEKVNV